MGAKKQTGKKTKKVNDTSGLSRGETLAAVIQNCNKALGTQGAVFLGKDVPVRRRWRTGIAALDYVTGGGLVEASLIQYTGGESSCKSTAAMITCATRQQDDRDAWVVWLAGEGFDAPWAKHWGMDLKRTIVVTAADGGSALETACTLIETNAVAILVMDSYQSLGTEREMEGGVDSESYAGGGAPQLWGRVMRRSYAAMNKGARTCLIGISQVRAKIGGFTAHGPPPPEGSGIWALKHWKSIDVDFSRGEFETEGEDEKLDLTRIRFKLRNRKNKTAVPMRKSSMLLEYSRVGARLNNVDALVKLGIRYDLIKTTGAWYQGLGVEKTNGIENFVKKLRKDPEAVNLLEEKLLEMYAQG